MRETIRRKALILTPFFLIIKPFLILFSSVGAEPVYLFCSNETTKYTLNSPFENNLMKLLFQILPSSTSTAGFNSTSIGETPNKVYGQALCRGDVNSTICQSCVENASRDILGQCKSKDAIIWYQLCQVHYSLHMFFNLSVYTGKYSPCDSQVVAKPAPFFKAVSHLMTNLTDQVSVNSSKPMFATGEVKFSRSETIYGLVQCTRDISVGDCKTCLASAYGDLKGSCNTSRGGILVSRNCNVRFEVYSFYNASSNLVTYPISSSGSGWKIWMIVSAACVAITSMVIGFCLFCCLRKREKQRGTIVKLTTCFAFLS